MSYRGFISAAVVAIAFSGQSAMAQSTSAIPAEFPPTSFAGNQFVDSKGCAFIRAGVGGAVTWVPRVDRKRQQLCNFQPSFAAATPVPAPVIAAPAPAPKPARNVGAPIRTVASTTTPPRITPRVTAPAPVVRSAQITPVVTPPPAPVIAPAPARQTLSAFCVGRTGPQPGFVSSSTGETIDCGGAPVIAPVTRTAVAAPKPAARQTRSAFCVGRSGLQPGFISSTTGQTIDCGGKTPAQIVAAASPTLPTMTMSQVCADISATGRNYVNAQTGLPVRCGPQTQPVSNGGIAVPSAPIAPSITAQGYSVANCPATILTVGNVAVRCGPQTQPVSDRVTRSTASVATRPLFGPKPIPASNPVGVSQSQVLAPPKGYTRVWDDGRHNPNRGLPKASVSSGLTESVSSRTIAPQAATAHRYVQVASLADSARAAQIGQQFQRQGLPVGLGTKTAGGQTYKVVILGPFSSAAQLNNALRAARGAGFGDAYTRN